MYTPYLIFVSELSEAYPTFVETVYVSLPQFDDKLKMGVELAQN